jgi:outer membrane biosynthesis protein TonB
VTAVSLTPNRSLTVPLSASLVLHIAIVTAFVYVKASETPPMMPPVYNVTLIAAPAGPRNVGVVAPAKVALEKAPPPRAKTAPPKASTQRTPPPRTAKATESVPKTAVKPDRKPEQAKAGGGDVGGKGADVANVKLEDGLDFPYPGYLQNIVNSIAKNFVWKGPQTFRADVAFLIRRDGSVAAIRVLSSSKASYDFKLEAQGAVEAAAKAMSFGPLPDGFPDDVLPVVFSFDPRIIK